MERKYYEINEETARSAHEMMSFRDYVKGSKTEEYKHYVDIAYDLADQIQERKPERADEAYYQADRYARKMADNMNRESRIGCMCPSVMISGGSNFPVRKKEKQVAAWDRNHEEYKEIQKILDKIRNMLTGKEVILSNDERAIEKLEDKLQTLREIQERMKNVNAYYRKNKTLDGCEDLTLEEIEKLKAEMSGSNWRYEDKPFMTWQLTNNNATIKNTEARINELKRVKDAGTTETETEFFKVVENSEAMRLQLFFDGKPDPEVRDLVKQNGFRWAPSQGCWQRQLTPNAKYSLKRLIESLKELQKGA